jgi:protein scribble
LQEVRIEKESDDKLGMVIKGGLQGQPGNPDDPTDEGVFISKINPGGMASKHSNELEVRNALLRHALLRHALLQTTKKRSR